MSFFLLPFLFSYTTAGNTILPNGVRDDAYSALTISGTKTGNTASSLMADISVTNRGTKYLTSLSLTITVTSKQDSTQSFSYPFLCGGATAQTVLPPGENLIYSFTAEAGNNAPFVFPFSDSVSFAFDADAIAYDVATVKTNGTDTAWSLSSVVFSKKSFADGIGTYEVAFTSRNGMDNDLGYVFAAFRGGSLQWTEAFPDFFINRDASESSSFTFTARGDEIPEITSLTLTLTAIPVQLLSNDPDADDVDGRANHLRLIVTISLTAAFIILILGVALFFRRFRKRY
jgi:hypothetical protein